jgi:hypothetical protein
MVKTATNGPAGRVTHALHDQLVGYGSDRSWGARLRTRRWQMFARAFPEVAAYRVVDLGGTVQSWLHAPVRPRHVTIVNIGELDATAPPWMDQIVADACSPPAVLFDRGFDLVYSNSVIEHVGGHGPRKAFARTVRSLASRHWVQTPYRYFPIEPHYLFPGFQFLSASARAGIARHWPLIDWRPEDHDGSVDEVLAIDLLGATEMGLYFPSSRLLRERTAGLTKSLIAVGD